MESTGAIAHRFGLSTVSVWKAIKDGRLPATEIAYGGTKRAYLVNPEDAAKLWGQKTPK